MSSTAGIYGTNKTPPAFSPLRDQDGNKNENGKRSSSFSTAVGGSNNKAGRPTPPSPASQPNFLKRVSLNYPLPSDEDAPVYTPTTTERLPLEILPESGIVTVRQGIRAVPIWLKLNVPGAHADASAPFAENRICKWSTIGKPRGYCSVTCIMGLHFLEVALRDKERARYANNKGISPDQVPDVGYVMFEDITRPPPLGKTSMYPRLLVNKKSVVAISLFDGTNSLLRALHEDVMVNEKYRVVRFISVGGSNEEDEFDRQQIASMAYRPPLGTPVIPDFPCVSNVVESTLKIRLFGEPNMRKICDAAVLEDQVQFVAMASPKTIVDAVQIPTFLEMLAQAATERLGFDARRSIHYFNVLPLNRDPDQKAKTRVLQALFPDDGATEFDATNRNSPSQLVRPTLFLSNRMGTVGFTSLVSWDELDTEDCVYDRYDLSIDALLAPHIEERGKWTVPADSYGRGKIVANYTHEVVKENKNGKNRRLPIPVTVYEELLGLPLNATGRATEISRRNHLLKCEPSQFHLKYVLLTLHREMAPASLQKNNCAYVERMPREIATGALADLERREAEPDPRPSKRHSVKEDEDLYKSILAAIDRIPPPTMPFNLTGYGYGYGYGCGYGSFGKRPCDSK